jgi:acetyl-CoA decarbonylase/synthase complex subunit alpha
MTEHQKVKIEKMKTDVIDLSNVIIEIGDIEKEWDEKVGPHPKPSMSTLREWDFKLLSRHKPLYTPVCDECCMCAFGKCDLTQDRKGACGIDLTTQQARQVAMYSAIGAACHAAHARHMLHHQIELCGRDCPIDLGDNVEVEAPIMRTVVGSKPETLGDMEKALDYAEEEITKVLASIHTGQEGNNLEYESKALHVGMIDNLVKEIGDIAQIVGYGMPKGTADAPLADLGFATLDRTKPLILMIGHNVAGGASMVDYLREHNLEDKVELAGICCTSHDLTRIYDKGKIMGPLSRTMKFLQAGIADVIVVDEQCIRTDVREWAEKTQTPLIASSEHNVQGLKDRTKDDPEAIISDLVEGRETGAFLLDSNKVAEVAVRTAMAVKPKREKLRFLPTPKEAQKLAKRCVTCEACHRVCPVNIHISEGMDAAKEGDLSVLASYRELCVGCTRCEEACGREIPIIKMIETAAQDEIIKDNYKIRVGRGPIQDVEIRKVGSPIVFGEIPGIVVFAGCSNYPNSTIEMAEMAEEFLKRNFIVVVSGCAAMEIARLKDEDGKTLYEKYPGDFDAGGLVNLGSCLSNAHVLGAAIKVANIFAKRDLRGNFEEIADYIYNRVGAVAVVWGTYSQKALSIGTGVNRWGIPVILGPQGTQYRRQFIGRKDKPETWAGFNARNGEAMNLEPVPEHLVYTPETKEEAMVWIVKLCLRNNDTPKGRMYKLEHYIDIHQKYMGTFPDDIDKYIRNKADIPLTKKDQIMKILEEKGWQPREVPDPTIVERLTRKPAAKEAGK